MSVTAEKAPSCDHITERALADAGRAEKKDSINGEINRMHHDNIVSYEWDSSQNGKNISPRRREDVKYNPHI